jgi:hypothetical protein
MTGHHNHVWASAATTTSSDGHWIEISYTLEPDTISPYGALSSVGSKVDGGRLGGRGRASFVMAMEQSRGWDKALLVAAAVET